MRIRTLLPRAPRRTGFAIQDRCLTEEMALLVPVVAASSLQWPPSLGAALGKAPWTRRIVLQLVGKARGPSRDSSSPRPSRNEKQRHTVSARAVAIIPSLRVSGERCTHSGESLDASRTRVVGLDGGRTDPPPESQRGGNRSINFLVCVIRAHRLQIAPFGESTTRRPPLAWIIAISDECVARGFTCSASGSSFGSTGASLCGEPMVGCNLTGGHSGQAQPNDGSCQLLNARGSWAVP